MHPTGLAAAALLSQPLSQHWVQLLPKPTAKVSIIAFIYCFLEGVLDIGRTPNA